MNKSGRGKFFTTLSKVCFRRLRSDINSRSVNQETLVHTTLGPLCFTLFHFHFHWLGLWTKNCSNPEYYNEWMTDPLHKTITQWRQHAAYMLLHMWQLKNLEPWQNATNWCPMYENRLHMKGWHHIALNIILAATRIWLWRTTWRMTVCWQMTNQNIFLLHDSARLVDFHFSFFCSRNQHSYIVTDASIVNTCKLARHKSRTLANVSEGSLS